MNFFKQLNIRLLENNPLLWHSKAIQLTIAGVLFGVVSFVAGYVMFGPNQMVKYNFKSYYFESNFIFFHLIFTLIVLAIWAVYFYKNNALKSLYPLSKFYLQKLFLVLFFPFVILVSAYYPFTLGVKTRVSTHLDEGELEKDLDKINLASAFLISFEDSDLNNYYLDSRSYPSPFPLNFREYDATKDDWSTKLYAFPEGRSEAYVKDSDIENYVVPHNPENTTTIDGMDYQFYESMFVYTSEDSCQHKDFVKRFHVLDSQLFNLSTYSIYNYSSLIENYVLDYERDRDYATDYAPRIHELVSSKSYSEIKQIMDNSVSVLEKYRIDHKVHTELILQYLKLKDFKGFNEEYSFYEIDYEYAMRLDLNKVSKSTNMNDLCQALYLMHIDYYGLNKMFSNFRGAEQAYFSSHESWIVFLFFALGLSTLFIFFEFINPISFLISIPIAGVLIIICAIIVMANWNFMPSELFPILVFTFMLLLIQVFNLIALFGRGIGKKVLNISMSLAYMSTLFVLPFILLIIHLSSEYHTFGKCDNVDYQNYFGNFLVDPRTIFLSILFSILLFLTLVKIWKAKAE